MDAPRRAIQRVAARGARSGLTSRGAGASKGNRTQLQVVEQFRRLHPPSFEGTTNPLDAEEWLRELEKGFTFINCTDDQKVACAFKELFNQKYFPEELRNEKESEFLRLTQGFMSLVEYERKF
ncbi:hypothetical protein EZV62_004879 [Acer yangbiense]|uniref:Retrotransposon gag domain-containing protein n=1 Tax=Acer yangbiense TaxID=1000413 RepID=A0A5C7IMB1_9ROSI|nr:hypothetical protein EZV62_004879 [Acer yangbiense]